MSTEVHTLSGAYALDALSSEEGAEFRAHLAVCAACRQEVGELREAAATMGATEADRAPESLKAKVLADADRTPQLPPLATTSSPQVTTLESVRRRRWVPQVAAAAAAAVIAVGVGVGVSQTGNDDVPMAAGVSQVFSADDAHTATVETEHGTVRVATSPGRGEMAVDASGLEKLDNEHVYQVWSIVDGESNSVGVLAQDLGAAMPMPPRGTQVAITVEPAGGSEQPTTNPIVAVDPATV